MQKWLQIGNDGATREVIIFMNGALILHLEIQKYSTSFFLNSSVLAVSVPLFVRINHESGQTICGLAWNPKGNKELAYSDNQVSFYLNQSSSLSRHNLLDDWSCTTVCPWKCWHQVSIVTKQWIT